MKAVILKSCASSVLNRTLHGNRWREFRASVGKVFGGVIDHVSKYAFYIPSHIAVVNEVKNENSAAFFKLETVSLNVFHAINISSVVPEIMPCFPYTFHF